jgi:hypothetical protein
MTSATAGQGTKLDDETQIVRLDESWDVDAQLPPALARWLTASGHETDHVANLNRVARGGSRS